MPFAATLCFYSRRSMFVVLFRWYIYKNICLCPYIHKVSPCSSRSWSLLRRCVLYPRAMLQSPKAISCACNLMIMKDTVQNSLTDQQLKRMALFSISVSRWMENCISPVSVKAKIQLIAYKKRTWKVRFMWWCWVSDYRNDL